MTRLKPAVLTALVTLLVLTLARCGGDESPTSWIPRNGVLTGTITVTSSSALSAPQASALLDPGAPAATLVFRRPSALDAFRARSLEGMPHQIRPSRRPSITSNELIVTFRSAALGAPPVGSAALRTTTAAGAVARAIRTRLATALSADAVVAGVAPAILAARGRIPGPAPP